MGSYSISIDTQHGDIIHDVQLDYYGKRLATCSTDNTIRIYSISEEIPELILEITEHSGPVWRIAWSHPRYGSLLASCSYDGTVRIFKLTKDKSYSTLYVYKGHKASVNAISWAPYEYGACLAAVSSDGCMSCIFQKSETEWESTIITICSLGCNGVSWAPFRPGTSEDASVIRLAIGAGDKYVHVMKCIGSPLNLWDWESKLRGHEDRVKEVVWSPYIGETTDVIASCGRDCKLFIWKKKGEKIWNPSLLRTYTESIWRLNWSVTGCMLVVSYGVNSVDMWKEMLDGKWKVVNKKSEVSSLFVC